MREAIDSSEVSLCVSPQGDAAVFVTGGDRPRIADLARMAGAFAARGLRLLGVSRSAHRAPTVCAAGTRSAVVTSESVIDAVLSLLDARDPVLAT